MPVPDFSPGEVLTAAAMDSIGLWLVKTQTVGAGVSSVTVTGAFSADYDNYKITLNGGTGGATTIKFALTGSGAGNYYAGYQNVSYTGTASTSSGNNLDSWVFAGGSRASGAFLNVELMQPFLTARTGFTVASRVDADTSGGSTNGNGYHNVAASYTGFTLTVDQPITGGTIRVYGYRN
jgi:hypothetical protein